MREGVLRAFLLAVWKKREVLYHTAPEHPAMDLPSS